MKNIVKLKVPRGSKIQVKQTMNRIAYAKPNAKPKAKPKSKKA